MQSSVLKLVLFSILIGLTKAHHFRMAVFAVLGLAGLWMVQNIAKSSSGSLEERSQLFPNFSVANLANRFLSKRSIQDEDNKLQQQIIDWDLVLTNDLSTCTRSYVCQLSANAANSLRPEEMIMLELIKQSSDEGTNWAKKQVQMAVTHGEKWRNKNACMQIYRKCPYSSATMLMLLNTFDHHERT